MRLPNQNLRFLPRIIGVLLLTLVAGCSAIKTGYNSAPTLLYWWLDGYAHFTTSQQPLVREALGTIHAWHRQQELPAYAEMLQRMQRVADGPVSAEQVCAFTHDIRARLHVLAEHSADGLSRVTPALQDEQIRQIAHKFDQNNRIWREEWLDGTARELLDRRVERATEHFERFYGRLSDPQLAQLRQRLAESGFDARLAWAERLRRQQDLMQVLQEHRGADRQAHVKAEMLALLKRYLHSPDPLYRAQFERMLQEGCKNIALLHNSASPAQRLHLVERLRGYATDFRELSARP